MKAFRVFVSESSRKTNAYCNKGAIGIGVRLTLDIRASWNKSSELPRDRIYSISLTLARLIRTRVREILKFVLLLINCML